MSPEPEPHAVFDGAGEMSLLEARRPARAGEMATVAPSVEDGGGLGAVFRAIAERLDVVGLWVERIRQDVVARWSAPLADRGPSP